MSNQTQELKNMPLIELAYNVLKEGGMQFQDLFAKVSNYKGFTTHKRDELVGQFYTDLNADGRFIISDMYVRIKSERESSKNIIKVSYKREAHCFACNSNLSTSTHYVCTLCRWIKCTCGACGCEY